MGKEGFLSFALRCLGVEVKPNKFPTEIQAEYAEQVRQQEQRELDNLYQAVRGAIAKK